MFCKRYLIQSYPASDEGNKPVNINISHAKRNQRSPHNIVKQLFNNALHSLYIETSQMEPKSHKYLNSSVIEKQQVIIVFLGFVNSINILFQEKKTF